MCAETPSLALCRRFCFDKHVSYTFNAKYCASGCENLFSTFSVQTKQIACRIPSSRAQTQQQQKTPKQTFDSCCRASFDPQPPCSIDAPKCIPRLSGTGVRMKRQKGGRVHISKNAKILFFGALAHMFLFSAPDNSCGFSCGKNVV